MSLCLIVTVSKYRISDAVVSQCPYLSNDKLTLTVHKQLIASQCLLELRAHESITRTRLREDREVNIKERQIDDKGNEDEADRASGKVPPEVFLQNRQHGVLRFRGGGEHSPSLGFS